MVVVDSFTGLLKELKLDQFEQNFVDDGWDDIRTFNSMVPEDVENCKFLKPGHKKKLLNHLQSINSQKKKIQDSGDESEEIQDLRGEEEEEEENSQIIYLENEGPEIIDLESEEETISTPKKRKRSESPSPQLKKLKNSRTIPILEEINKLVSPNTMLETFKKEDGVIDDLEVYVGSLEDMLLNQKLKLSCRFIPKIKSISWVKCVRFEKFFSHFFIRDQISLNLMNGKNFLIKMELSEEKIFNSIIEYIKGLKEDVEKTYLEYLVESTSDFFSKSNISISIVIFNAFGGVFDHRIFGTESTENNSITLWMKMTGF
jgi:hypothetical protein